QRLVQVPAEAGARPLVEGGRGLVEVREVQAHPRRLATRTSEDDPDTHRLTGTSQVVRHRLPANPTPTSVSVVAAARGNVQTAGINPLDHRGSRQVTSSPESQPTYPSPSANRPGRPEPPGPPSRPGAGRPPCRGSPHL